MKISPEQKKRLAGAAIEAARVADIPKTAEHYGAFVGALAALAEASFKFGVREGEGFPRGPFFEIARIGDWALLENPDGHNWFLGPRDADPADCPAAQLLQLGQEKK